ncbi:MAG: SUMF1/EgtB/PvdO family nonheme iron enzyme [Treponema sp.]|nr:SUMF1/EgtB/PvdO family nonheme iron enzyme [Candidatus Treponema caballi]
MKRNHSSPVVHGSLFAEAFFIFVLACLLVSCRPDTKLAMHGIPAGTYTIHHYKQKTTGGKTLADYTLAETETGKVVENDSDVSSVAKSYTGFNAPSVSLLDDVVNLFYDRKSVTYTFNTGNQGWFSDGATSRRITGLYGGPCDAPINLQTDPGWQLAKWVIQGGTEFVPGVFGLEDQTCQAEYVWCSPPSDDFVYIPAGTFMMGNDGDSSEDQPAHEVTLTRAYFMCNHEVTQGEYESYCTYGGTSPGDPESFPAYYVSWYDAIVYCNKRSSDEGLTQCYSIGGSTNPTDWINQYSIPQSASDSGYAFWNSVVCDFTANGYRLPTEAEWERAARAGSNAFESRLWSGTSVDTDLGDYAWYGDSSQLTQVVKRKNPNSIGLFDMTGNVSEWCWDWNSAYSSESVTDPIGPGSSDMRISRGGDFRSEADNCAVSRRASYQPFVRSNKGAGFRVVRTANP